ncbi:MAG: glycosyl hydrolase family 28-related protein [Planctomycetota bacterium]|jgi:hypothetical protein|nr:glycosyl hydrolase family 28-related protein [Planctomycetota bacterium]
MTKLSILPIILFCAALGHLSAVEYVFPPDAGIIDVKRDFGATGDGKTDDTEAIQRAIVTALLGDYRNPPFIYLPNGTYRITKPLKARITDVPDGEGGWSDGWRGGLALVGQSRDKTILKLSDKNPLFANPDKPLAMIYTGSTDHSRVQKRTWGCGNEGFQNTLMNFTVDTGRGNAGAMGISYLASNRGTLEEITVRSGDPDKRGVCGISLTRYWPGPALVKRVSVDGFDVALHQDGMDCSMTYEHLELSDQKVCAIRGTNQPFMSLRGVVSRNAVPAFIVDGKSAFLNVLDSTFIYTGTGTAPPAITCKGYTVLKHIAVEGYPVVLAQPGKTEPASAVVDLSATKGTGKVALFTSRDPSRAAPGPTDIPDLPIKETPIWHSTDLTKWANVQTYAAGSRTAGIQEAIDSGAEVVYLPNGHYQISETIVLRGSVRKIFGCEAKIGKVRGTTVEPMIRFEGVKAKTVFLEHLGIGGEVEHDCDQTLVIRKCDTGYHNTPRGTGDVFIEDGMFDHPQVLYPQNLWARQLNSEFGNRPNFTNRGGNAWILGMKVEGWVGGILNIGGVTECYALYAMTGENGKQPFVENRDGWVAVSFRDGGQKNHKIKLKDTWQGETHQIENWHREYCLVIGGQRQDGKPAAATAPGSLQATADDSATVTLTWTASPDPDLSHYLISRNGEAFTGTDAEVLTYTDTHRDERSTNTYSVVAVNLAGGMSKPVTATATTPADMIAPTLEAAGIWPTDASVVTIDMSEPLAERTASTVKAYTITPAVPIRTARLSGDGSRVVLEFAKPLQDGQTYTVTWSGLTDRSKKRNPVAVGQTEFTAWLRGDGLRLEFWNDKESFDGEPVATTTETKVDHWWGDGAPVPGVTPGAFCARWTGVIRPTVSGEYRFKTGLVSGGRVFLDGTLIHDVWNSKNEWTDSKAVTLEAGKRYNLVFEMHATRGHAGARLKWKVPGNDKSQFLNERVLFLP